MTLRFEHLDLVTVTGTFSLLDGNPATGAVTFTPSVVLIDTVANRTIFPVPLRVVLSAGMFSIDLPATDDPDLSPTGWTYQVVEMIDGSAGRTYSLAIPLGSSPLAIASVSPVPTSPGVVAPFPTAGRMAALELAFGG